MLQRGSEAGQTRVALRVRDQRPFRVYGGYENTGTELTGEDRALAGFNLGNLWGRGHRLGYQGTMSTESSGFEAHSLDYVLPLPWRHELRVFAVDQSSDPSENEEGFDLSADNTQYGARYEVPIVTRGSLSSGLRQSIVLGYDAKKSNNDLLFGGSRVLDNTTDISQGRLGYRFTRPDGFGYFDGYIDGVWSPGSDSEDAAFAEQRALATSDYTYVRASLNRHTRFSARWNWQLNLVGQWADGNLLPSEQLGIGGHDTVRGYEEFAQLGDQGVIVNNELHFLTRLFGLLPQPLDLFTFYDYGLVSNVDLLPDERDNRDLSSVGVGLRFQYKSVLSFSLAYGHQLTAVEPGEDEDNRLHASLLLAF